MLQFGKDVAETPERRERGAATESRGEWIGRAGIFPLGVPLSGVEGIPRIETLTTQVVSVPSSVLRSFGASLCVRVDQGFKFKPGVLNLKICLMPLTDFHCGSSMTRMIT